jgi:hypothetical protein
MGKTYRIRAGLVAVAAILGMLVVIQPGHSQLRPPGAPSFPNRPPIGPGGPGGFNPPSFPSFPQQPPAMPRPGGGPAMYQWSCGRCGRVLGSGPVPPATAFCPVCQINNTIPPVGGVGGIVPPPTPPINPPVFVPPANPPVMNRYEGGVNVPPPVDTSDSSGLRGWVIPAVGLGVLVLLGIGITAIIMTMMNQTKSKKRRRRRPRPRYDDDDDY